MLQRFTSNINVEDTLIPALVTQVEGSPGILSIYGYNLNVSSDKINDV